jgi:parallel beta-helix repeat protein
MNKKLGLFILVILGISTIVVCYRLPPVKAIIWIEGHITSDTTWKPIDTYRIIGDTYVDPGVTLTIESGVHVEFADGFSLIVNGSLYAVGTPDKLINFTSSRQDPSPGVWKSIEFIGGKTESFTIKYSAITYAKNGITVATKDGYALIEKCEIRNNSESGIMVAGKGNVIIKENTIRQNKNGIGTSALDNYSGIAIVNNTISFNQENGIYLYSRGGNTYIHNVTLLSNAVSSSGRNGIYLCSEGGYGHIYNVTLLSNAVSSSGGNGIYICSQGAGSYFSIGYVYDVTLSSNNVSSSGGNGIHLYSHGWGYSNGTGYVYNITISSNNVASSGGNGIHLFSYGEGHPSPGTTACANGYSYVHDITLSSNNVASSEGNGIYLDGYGYGDNGDGYGYVYDVTLSSNKVSSSGGNGIHLYSHGGGYFCSAGNIYRVTFWSNNVSSSGENGIHLYSKGYKAPNYVYDVTLSSNNVSSSGGNGIHLYSEGYKAPNYVYDVTLSSNKVSSNNANGIHVKASNHHAELVYDVLMSGNIVSANSQKGIWVEGGINANLSRNSVSYGTYGVFYAITKNNLAKYNDIYSNTYGMNVTDGATVNAEYNYWGNTDGPYHPSLNHEGKGNSVNGNGIDLDFIPFLSAPIAHINERPIAILKVDKTIVDMNETATFDATGAIDDGRIDYYFFDFGDGTNSSWTTLPVVTHKYTLNGTYKATLIVMDDYGVPSLDGDLVYVEITVVPEFPRALIIPLFMILSLLVILFAKKYFLQNSRLNSKTPFFRFRFFAYSMKAVNSSSNSSFL